MTYEVNTFVSHRGGSSNPNQLINVLTFVDSKSNFASSGTAYITSTDQFKLNFPEPVNEYSKTLKDAYQILEMGYNLLCVNVRNCTHYETLRLYQEDDGTISEGWFDTELSDISFPTTVNGDSNLAVQFHITEIEDGKYVLLEHDINGKPENTLVYFTSDPENATPPIHQGNFSARSFYPIKYLPDDQLTMIKQIQTTLTTKESYTFNFTETGYIQLAYPYPFNISAGDPSTKDKRRIEPSYTKEFEQVFISRSKRDKAILSVMSSYTSDIEDLELEIYQRGYDITVNLYKYSNNKIWTTESYTSTDFDSIITKMNLASRFVYIVRNKPDSKIPIGKWKLKLNHTPVKISSLSYEHAIVELGEEDTEDLSALNAAMLYEPDLSEIATAEEQKWIQDILDAFFSSQECPIIKLFVYRGQELTPGDIFTAYFSDAKYLYNKQVCDTRMMYLYNLIDILADNYITTVQPYSPGTIAEKDLPYQVNVIHEGFRNISFDRIKVNFMTNMYDIRDLLLIITFNLLLNTAEKTRIDDFLIIDIIETIEQYFQLHFQYNPNIKLTSFKRVNEDTVHISIAYFTSDMREVKALNLFLDLT